MPESIIQLKDVYKIYPMGTQKVHALDGITLSFAKGSFWSIMGASGSGKSTMMNLLGCLDRPTSGTYVLNNHSVAEMDDNKLSDVRLQNMGFVFQSFNLIPQLSVQENIELPMFYLGYEPEESSARAEELAEKVGLADRLKHKPTELSGGERQRVALARALTNDPPVILADEPTGNLDTKTGKQIMEMFVRLNEQGKTIIIVTHEKDIAAYTKSQLRMCDGKIENIKEVC